MERTANITEWGSAEQVYVKFGLSKSALRKLAEQGKIKEKLIKDRPEARKGIRVYELESIRNYLSDDNE